MRLAAALSLLLGLAACSQGDSDNVMAAGANSLTPAQVDLALGPELANTAGNALTSNEAGVTASENAVEAADTEDALDESVPDEGENQPPATNNGLEQ